MLRQVFRRLIRANIKSQNRSFHQANHWSFGSLEERILLAADSAVAVSHDGNFADQGPIGDYASDAAVYGKQLTSQAEVATSQASASVLTRVAHDADVSIDTSILTATQDSSLVDSMPVVFIDERVESYEHMLRELKDRAEVHIVPRDVSGLDFIGSVLKNSSGITSIHLIGHGSAGYLDMGQDGLNNTTLNNKHETLTSWKQATVQGADLLIYGCETAQGSDGENLIRSLSAITGLDVAGSVDKTGAEVLQANWVLEVQIGNIESDILFSEEFKNDLSHPLAIVVRAFGQTGDEEMALLIDNQVVQTWTGIQTGVSASYVYEASGIAPERIRVAFTNDFSDGSYDRNLTVTSVSTDTTHMSINPETLFYNSAAWNSTTNTIESGFTSNGQIVANGYIQFQTPTFSNKAIFIDAAGQTGDERLSLLIDDEIVKSWTNFGDQRQFAYFTEENVAIDRIKILFDNDASDISTGYDRNIRVNAVTTNGTRYSTSESGVFNSSTWNEEIGVVEPGFYNNGNLFTNGYLTFNPDINASGDTILIRASGTMGGEQMNLKIGGEVVKTWIVTSGAESNNYEWYAYRLDGQAGIDSVQIEFVGDHYIEGVLDKNLRIDKVLYNGVAYETESSNNLKMRYWTPTGPEANFDNTEYLYSDGYVQFYSGTGELGHVGFASSRYSVSEDSELAVIHVVRSGSTDGALLIDYTTVNNTAISGQDYIGKSGTLSFLPGQSTATITISLLNDSIFEGNETFNVTIDNLRGSAVLAAPRTATVLINDDDTVLPNYVDFSNSSGLKLNGAATASQSGLQLTPATPNAAGSAFFEQALPISATTSFQTEFVFEFTGGVGNLGGNGFAFVIQNSNAGASALGNSVGGLPGYGGLQNSLSVEFDITQNSGEVSASHISVVLDGSTSSLVTKNYSFSLNRGAIYRAWVDYNGDAKVLSVFVSNGTVKPAVAIASVNIDLEDVLGAQGYLGFTSSNSQFSTAQRIYGWSVSLTPPNVSPTSIGSSLAKEVVATGFINPTDLEFSPDGSNIYVSQQNGIVHVIRNGVRQSTPFIDISAQVNGTRDRGLLDIAVHPDFENNPYVYLLFTYDPPEVYQNVNHTLAGPDRNGNRAGRLIRVTADASTNYTTAVAGSEVVLLGKNSTWANFNAFANSTSNFNEPPAGIKNGVNVQDFIASDSESHSVGSLAFGLDGSLFVSIGDGTSYNQVDPRTVRVQDIDNLSGKILRIDPLTGEGLADNPFYNGDPDANRSKVYQLGLRNPFRITVDSATGKLFIGDVGWSQWEEINSAGPGANFGWPYYEGGNGTSIRTNGYQNLAQAQAFYASGAPVVAPVVGRSHSATGINAIVTGSVYRGDAYPDKYDGDIFFNDLGQGIVSNVSFNADGTVASIETFATGAQYVTQIMQGVDGNLYYTSLVSGEVGRWIFV